MRIEFWNHTLCQLSLVISSSLASNIAHGEHWHLLDFCSFFFFLIFVLMSDFLFCQVSKGECGECRLLLSHAGEQKLVESLIHL